MPFTFSHPAIVLPLNRFRRKWFSLTGLVLGSMAPDFEYFLRMRIRSDYSHTPGGIFWFDLPLVILLAFIFHNIVRNSLVDNLPAFLRSRFSPCKTFDWNGYFRKSWIVVIVSALVGIVSHLLWDSFTHADGLFVRQWPTLQHSVVLFDRNIPIYKIAQHGSSLLGALFILYFLLKLPKREIAGSAGWWYWVVFFGWAAAVVAVRVLAGPAHLPFGNLVVTVLSAAMISSVLTPVFLKAKK